jgi:hypothetical protein
MSMVTFLSGGNAMRKKFPTLEEEQADQLDKAIKRRESIARVRQSRCDHLAHVRAAHEARMEAAIEAMSDKIEQRIAKMREAKLAWMRSGFASINIPERFVKYVELD